MLKIKWPVALATMFLVLLGWYLVYTESIVRALEDNAERLSEIYHEVQAGLATMDQSAAITAMFNLQGIIIESGVPPRFARGSEGDTRIHPEPGRGPSTGRRPQRPTNPFREYA